MAKQGMKFMAIEGQEDKEKLSKWKEIYPKTTKGNQRKLYQSQWKQPEHEMTDIAKCLNLLRSTYILLYRRF